MRPTLQYVEEKFDYYNNLCFGGQLPRPLIKLTQRRESIGRTNMSQRCIDGKYIRNASIEISIRYDYPEVEYIDTIVHEMIHYYMWMNNIDEESAHGPKFRAIMNEITQKYGIRITIQCDESEEAMIARVTDQNRYICVITDTNDDMALAIVIRDKIFQYWDIVPQLPNIKGVKWYVSNRAIFAQFPARIKPYFIRLEPTKIQDYLFGAAELERIDNVIKPKEQ